MFGYKLVKAKIIDDAAASFRKATEIIEQRDQTIREMADEIRSMDQLIYQMSQCPSWEAMRPFFNDLQAKQEFRQREESNRITDIMRKELISVYAPEPKQLPLATQGHSDNPTRHRPR